MQRKKSYTPLAALVGGLITLTCLGTSLTALHAQGRPALEVLTGHTTWLKDVDLFTWRGRPRALTLGVDGSIKLWDVNTGALEGSWRMEGHERPFGVRGGPSGKALVVGDYNMPYLLDLEAGTLKQLPRDIAGWHAAAVCADPSRESVVVAWEDKDAVAYDLTSGKVVAQFGVAAKRASSCAFNADGSVVAIGGIGDVSWHDAGREFAMLDQRAFGRFRIDQVAAAPKGPVWALASNVALTLWDLDKREKVASFDRPEVGSAGLMRWSDDGRRLLLGGTGNQSLIEVDAVSGKRQAEHKDPSGISSTTRWITGSSSLGDVVAVMRREDRDVELWSAKTGKRVQVLPGLALTLSSLAFMSDGRHVAIGTQQGEVQIWDILTMTRQPAGFHAGSKPITALGFSPDGAWIVTGEASGDLVLRRADTGKEDRRLHVAGAPTSIAFLDDSRTFVVRTSSNTRFFRADTGAEGSRPDWLRGGLDVQLVRGGKRAVNRTNGSVEVTEQGSGARTIRLDGTTRQLLATPDGTRAVVTLADGSVKLLDLDAGTVLRSLTRPPGAIERMTASPDGRIVAASTDRGTLAFWRTDRDQQALVVFADQAGEWIAWTPDGAFDGSNGGGAYVAWRVGPDIFPLSQFKARYQVPGLAAYMLGRGEGKVEMKPLAAGFSTPPQVSIVGAGEEVVTSQTSIAVEVEVTDTGGGVQVARLYHQGRLVAENDTLAATKSQTIKFELTLEPGANSVVATATSKGGIESQTPVMRIEQRARPHDVRMRVLAIGINNYRDGDLKLASAVDDAKAMSEALTRHGKKLFGGQIETRLVLDKDATTDGIVAGFEWLIKNTRTEDVAVVYFAGHGETEGDDYYFIPQEMTYSGEGAVAQGGLSQHVLKSLIRRIPARKVVVLLDTCKSGRFSETFGTRGFTRKKALSQFGQTTGTYMVAATTSQQLALESSGLGHGIFTHAVLEALSGKGDLDRDGEVSVRELVTFVEKEVARITLEKYDVEQFPVTSGNGRNFPLAVTR